MGDISGAPRHAGSISLLVWGEWVPECGRSATLLANASTLLLMLKFWFNFQNLIHSLPSALNNISCLSIDGCWDLWTSVQMVNAFYCCNRLLLFPTAEGEFEGAPELGRALGQGTGWGINGFEVCHCWVQQRSCWETWRPGWVGDSKGNCP